MNHKKVALAVLLITVIIGVSYGAIQYTRVIETDGTVKGHEICAWRLDSGIEVTSISWGTLGIGQSKDSDVALGLPTTTHKLAIKNTGDYGTYVGWQIDPMTPLPTGVTLMGHHANMETEPYQPTWGENVFTFQVPPHSISNWRIRWTLSVGAGAVLGDFTVNILLLGADSSSG